MSFNVALESPPNLPRLKETDEPVEDWESLVIDACLLLGETNCRFIAGGFGDDQWPVDVRYDLSTVIEQLPDLLNDLRTGKEGLLDFYGQGIARWLEFSPTGRLVEIRCRSGTEWEPNPAIEHADLDQLEAMLVNLAADFATALHKVSPDLARTAPIPAWRRGEI